MDLRDAFRRFLGLPNRQYPPPNWDDKNFHSYDSFYDDEDDNASASDDCYDNSCPLHGENKEPNNSFRFGFGLPDDDKGGLDGMFEHFHGDMWRQMEALHKQMDEMMKGFGAIDFPQASQPPHFSPLPPSQPEHGGTDEKPNNRGGHHFFFFDNTPSPFFGHEKRSKQNPRDFMLKDGLDEELQVPVESQARKEPKIGTIFTPNDGKQIPSNKQDTDLDGKLSDNEILSLVKRPPSEQIEQRKPQFFSSGSSMSFTTVRGADGRVEQKKVVRNSSGQEEITVTRSLGDQTHTVTTITGGDGLQEKYESFQNLDEKDLSSFEQQWSKPSGSSSSPANSLIIPSQIPKVDSSDRDIFSRLFDWKIK